jgi:hypothetical protein
MLGKFMVQLVFFGYRQFPDGTKGPAEIAKFDPERWDKIIGAAPLGKHSKVIITFREWETKFGCTCASRRTSTPCVKRSRKCGDKGKYAIEEP